MKKHHLQRAREDSWLAKTCLPTHFRKRSSTETNVGLQSWCVVAYCHHFGSAVHAGVAMHLPAQFLITVLTTCLTEAPSIFLFHLAGCSFASTPEVIEGVFQVCSANTPPWKKSLNFPLQNKKVPFLTYAKSAWLGKNLFPFYCCGRLVCVTCRQ